MMRRRDAGLTMLEMLLVLVVVAAITIVSMRGYQAAQTRMRIQQIRQDQHTILQALNSYYHRVGCTASGVFPEDKRLPTWADLGLPSSQGVDPPMVASYAVAIVENGTTTASRPLYALQMTATLASDVKATQVTWLAQALGVKVVSGHVLTWSVPPNNRAAKQGNALWGITASGAQFKWQENKKAGAVGTSPSYCAN